MKYYFDLSAKADINLTVENKHKKVIDGLTAIEKPWGIQKDIYQVPNFEGNISAILRLNKLLGSGIKGDVIYTYRHTKMENNDDRIFIEFNPKKIDYKFFCSRIIKQYIKLFEPYKAFVCDEKLAFHDFDEFRETNAEKRLYRFYPIFYWNENYCHELLGMSTFELKSILINNVESVELFNTGIIVIVSSKLLNIEEANEIDIKFKRIIGMRKNYHTA